jgi:hypothetical protein
VGFSNVKVLASELSFSEFHPALQPGSWCCLATRRLFDYPGRQANSVSDPGIALGGGFGPIGNFSSMGPRGRSIPGCCLFQRVPDR